VSDGDPLEVTHFAHYDASEAPLIRTQYHPPRIECLRPAETAGAEALGSSGRAMNMPDRSTRAGSPPRSLKLDNVPAAQRDSA
jgi:hypothetical protein